MKSHFWDKVIISYQQHNEHVTAFLW